MSIYKKLQKARMTLQNTKLSKSGKNKFAGYEYFELGDFLPQIQAICNDIGLCGVVSFDNSMAYLVIYDTESDGAVTFTSPMSTAALKGCHDVQNLGAVQTYLRRYLWTNAFEIVEHDALDATTGSVEPKKYEAPSLAKSTVAPVTSKVTINATLEPEPKTTVTLTPKPIVGQKGEFQIVAKPKPVAEEDIGDWLDNIKETAEALLGLAENEEDIMAIFKKNKVLFDIVKDTDAIFFKELMNSFTTAKNAFKKG